MQLFKEVTLQHKAVASAPEPSIRIARFADWSVEITIMFWCSQVFRVENIKSELRVAIFKAMAEHNIGFPYPQQVFRMPASNASQEPPTTP